MIAAGTRVWCVRDATDTTVYAYGYGTYLGDFPRPGGPDAATLALCEAAIRRSDAGPPIIDMHAYLGRQVADGKMTRVEADTRIVQIETTEAESKARPMEARAREMADRLWLNPKIALDNGGIVWGYECWWEPADEDTAAARAKGREIVTVPAPQPTKAVG